MTYKELMRKAQDLFDPQHRGIIYGYPVRVLLNIALKAEQEGDDQQVDVDSLRDYLSEKTHLDPDCVSSVLALL